MVAATVVVLPSATDVNGAWLIATLITADALIVAVAESLVVPSVTEVAVMVTTPPAGAAAGAI
jgi:hypothetical protein